MGNLHQVVVNDIGQMVCRQLVGTLIEHLVVNDVTLYAHLATYKVVDKHLAARLNLEAYHVLLAGSHQRFHIFLGHGQRIAHL